MSERTRAIAATPIRSCPGYWLVDTNDSLILASSSQVSCVFPKKAPFVTSGYWDDIALAGIPRAGARKLAVLGAGVGSFIPLLRSYNPELSLTCVEWNREIAEAGMRIRQVLDIDDASEWHFESATTLASAVWSGVTDVFVDLYLPDSISPLSLEPALHDAIRRALPDDGLVFLNVYDQLCGCAEESPTGHFVSVLREGYASGVVLRRTASSTLVCAKGLPAEALEQTVRQMLSRAHPAGARGIREIIPFGKVEGAGCASWRDLLRFDRQARDANAFVPPAEGLARSAFDMLCDLAPADFMRLARKRMESPFLR